MNAPASENSALVTGASGFIGRHLVESLLASGVSVRVLCRSGSQIPLHWNGRVERLDCDDWTAAGVQRAVGAAAFDVLYHLAAYGVHPGDRDARLMTQINTDLGGELVRLCRARGAVMAMAGSSAEYGCPEGRMALTEESPLEDSKIYGASKAAGTLKACAVASELGTSICVLRLFNVYGPGEAAHRLLPVVVAGLAAGRRVALSPGTQMRDFVYVGDVVEALRAASESMRSRAAPLSAIWNVGTGIGHTVREFAQLAAQILGKSNELLGFGDQAMRADEVPYLVASCDRISSELGWSARHSLEDGIKAALSLMTLPAAIGARP